jgi:ferrous iron transport protein B
MFLHPVAGPLIFLTVVVAVFQSIFTWARPPLMNGVQALVTMSGGWMGHIITNPGWHSLIVEGVWGGVGSVVVFLPQIHAPLLFIGVLEDSGYLARAAIIADRQWRASVCRVRVSFPCCRHTPVPCPAIMATRTIENKRDRFPHSRCAADD